MRTIIVGDIHGCNGPFTFLLQQLGADPGEEDPCRFVSERMEHFQFKGKRRKFVTQA